MVHNLVWRKCNSFSLYPQMKSCTPKNLDVPPKMKVKGYMYPQMKKPVGILSSMGSVYSVLIR